MSVFNPFLTMSDEELDLTDMSDVYTLAAEVCSSTSSAEFEAMFEILSERLNEEQERRWLIAYPPLHDAHVDRARDTLCDAHVVENFDILF